jgi:hypothetical protein
MRRRGSHYRTEVGAGRALLALPAALKAVLAQASAWAISILLLGLEVIPPQAWVLVLVQCALAALAALTLRSEPWWIPIHLGFAPALLLARGLAIAPGWYLAAFAALVAIYWTSFRTRVPLYLSNRATVSAVAELITPADGMKILDIGSGTGSLLIPLARMRPDCNFRGIEAAPAPYLVSRIRSRGLHNIRFDRGDFFDHPWGGYDLVYAFLSPIPMQAVWDKARREMSPGHILVSNSFPVPGRKPDRVIEVGDARGTRLFVYNQQSTEKQEN